MKRFYSKALARPCGMWNVAPKACAMPWFKPNPAELNANPAKQEIWVWTATMKLWQCAPWLTGYNLCWKNWICHYLFHKSDHHNKRAANKNPQFELLFLPAQKKTHFHSRWRRLPPITKIVLGVRELLDYKPETLIAVGGGSAIDSSKAILFLSELKNDPLNRNLPKIKLKSW